MSNHVPQGRNTATVRQRSYPLATLLAEPGRELPKYHLEIYLLP